MKKLTTEEFIRRAKDIHGDKYDYSKVVYKGVDIQVTIICPIHGEFQQTPYHHINLKRGCRKCANELTSKRFSSTTDEFIRKSVAIHGDKYDYSKVVYKKAIMPVTIICPIHGEFQQTPHDHLRYHGCPKCAHIQKIKSLSSTTEEFIKKAREVHGDKYDYSKTNYINANTKVCIICPEHGEFWQIPNSHISGSGCPKCVGKEQITTEDFINRAREIHGNKYDYSKVEYKGIDSFVTIICPEHGEFTQTPYHHLKRRQGCPKCAGRIVTTDEFIKKAREIHGDKYDYSKVEYINSRTKICIICPKHGEFWITPHSHLTGHGCHKCSCKCVLSTEEFVKRAREIHGNKYDYSEVEYKNYDTKVCIICSEHGEFWQMPHSHLQGNGCPVCGKLKLREQFQKTNNDFIEQARKVHGNKYDYSKTEYVNANTKVCITCPVHGDFWQTPDNHLRKQGCPNCIISILENEIDNFLKENNINCVFQKRFKWLGKQSLDFYLPDYNIGIECQGRQHFQIVSHFGGESGLDKTIRRDKIKFDKCNKRGICLCYYITNEIDENTIIDNEFYGKIYTKNNIFKKIDYILTKIKEKNLVKPK